MKKALFILFSLISLGAAAQVPLAGYVSTIGPNDTYPIAPDSLIWGGYHTTYNRTTRDAIPAARRKVGMMVRYAVNTDSAFVLSGGITNSNWASVSSGLSPGSVIQNQTAVLQSAGFWVNSGKINNAPVGATDIVRLGDLNTAISNLSGTYLQKANNLSDLANIATARTNINVPSVTEAGAIAQDKVDDYDLFVHYNSNYFINNGGDPNGGSQNASISLFGNIGLGKSRYAGITEPAVGIDYSGLTLYNYNQPYNNSNSIKYSIDKIDAGHPIPTGHIAAVFTGSLMKFDNFQRINVPANVATDDHDLITLAETNDLISAAIGGVSAGTASNGIYKNDNDFQLAPLGSGESVFDGYKEINIGDYGLNIGTYFGTGSLSVGQTNASLNYINADITKENTITLDGTITITSAKDNGDHVTQLTIPPAGPMLYVQNDGYGINYASFNPVRATDNTLMPRGYITGVVAGLVPGSRTLTINGQAFNLTSDRSWTISPSGSAGGDLTGTYPSPTVNTINGITKSFYDPTSSIQGQFNGKQATLVSGTNIKTINSNPILGSGNITLIAPTGTSSQFIMGDGSFNSTVYAPLASPFINVTNYGIVGDSTTDNTTALRALFNNVITKGATVYFPSGSYKITDSVIVKYTVKILGNGGIVPYSGTGGASPVGTYQGGNSVIFTTSSTASALVINASGVIVNDIAIKNIATTPTNGSGISINKGNGFRMNNVFISDFYNNFSAYSLTESNISNSQFVNPINYSVFVGGLIDDEGDNTFYANTFNSSRSSTAEYMHIIKPGGIRINNNKFHIAVGQTASPRLRNAINISTTTTTSDILIQGNSIEAYSNYGVLITQSSGTQLNNIIITNNQFGKSSATNSNDIHIEGFGTGTMQNVNVSGNTISNTGAYASIYLKNIQNYKLLMNTFISPALVQDSIVTSSLGNTFTEAAVFAGNPAVLSSTAFSVGAGGSNGLSRWDYAGGTSGRIQQKLFSSGTQGIQLDPGSTSWFTNQFNLGGTSGNGRLNLAAGTGADAAIPVVFNSGTLAITPRVGAFEFLTDRLYFTQSTGTTRQQLAYVGDLSGYAPTTRTLTPTYGGTGGGDLSANRTFGPDTTIMATQARVAANYAKNGSAAYLQRLSFIGTGGNGYLQLPSQSVSPASLTGNLRIYSDSLNRLSWKNSTYRRTIQVPMTTDVTIRMPYLANPTLVDSTQADGKFLKLSTSGAQTILNDINVTSNTNTYGGSFNVNGYNNSTTEQLGLRTNSQDHLVSLYFKAQGGNSNFNLGYYPDDYGFGYSGTNRLYVYNSGITTNQSNNGGQALLYAADLGSRQINMYRAITAATTIDPTSDYTIDVTSGTFTQPLPIGTITTLGQIYLIKNSGAGVVTVSGGGTIDGASSVVINPGDAPLQVQQSASSGAYKRINAVTSAGGGGTYTAGNGLTLTTTVFSADTAILAPKNYVNNFASKVFAAATYTPQTRTINNGYGLTGFGNLSADRTPSVDSTTVGTRLYTQNYTFSKTQSDGRYLTINNPTATGTLKTPALTLTGITIGTAGTDSILVKKSADNKTYKIRANYYAAASTTAIAVRLTGSGTGAATTISIPHLQTGVTSASIASVTPINAASAGISYITTDATNVNIIYTVAPAAGTNNLSYNLFIKP